VCFHLFYIRTINFSEYFDGLIYWPSFLDWVCPVVVESKLSGICACLCLFLFECFVCVYLWLCVFLCGSVCFGCSQVWLCEYSMCVSVPLCVCLSVCYCLIICVCVCVFVCVFVNFCEFKHEIGISLEGRVPEGDRCYNIGENLVFCKEFSILKNILVP